MSNLYNIKRQWGSYDYLLSVRYTKPGLYNTGWGGSH